MFSTNIINKQDFINSLKSNQNLVIYMSTTVALMLTLMIHGLIQGHVKPVYFAYAFVVSAAFYLWAVIDNKYRKTPIKFYRCIK